tara:strand:- start:5194 stop:6654 length:1461 start_codon:yes stop_codon:yes gene_type:complete
MTAKVRTRFAPSPTGFLHVGGARTALYSWLFAKKMQGDFVLRIEDTDQERSTEESLQKVLSDLKWLGYDWQEGPEVNGPNQPYFQSQRQAIYQEHAERLLKAGKAYYCFCSDERLESLRETAKKEGRSPQYDGHCRKVSKEEAKERLAAGEKATVRFQIPEEKDHYVFQDLIRKEVKFPKEMVGDFILLRSDGMPVYNFCCAVDDALMNITHVLRAEEHLSNTLRQIMILEALDYPLPQFGHLSIILGADKQKLSKRHGATSCHEYAERGFLPEALSNFLALLGWSHPEGKEIMPLEELVETFSLDRVHGSPAVFDEEKLKWMNSQYLRALSNEDLWQRIQPFLTAAGLDFSDAPEDWKNKTLDVFKSSMETLVDAVALYQNMSDAHFQVDEEACAEVLSWDTTKAAMEVWLQGLKDLSGDYLSEEDFLSLQDKVKSDLGVKGKHLFMPLRVAVIGKPQGAEMKLLVPLLAKSSLQKRVEIVLEKI